MKYLIILLLFLPTSISSAELTGKSYPYYIFNDNGVERWCMQPDGYGDQATTCWTLGMETLCDVLKPEDGFIDCRPEV